MKKGEKKMQTVKLKHIVIVGSSSDDEMLHFIEFVCEELEHVITSRHNGEIKNGDMVATLQDLFAGDFLFVCMSDKFKLCEVYNLISQVNYTEWRNKICLVFVGKTDAIMIEGKTIVIHQEYLNSNPHFMINL